MTYQTEDHTDKNLEGFVYFKVSGVSTLGGKASFEIHGSDGKIFCSSNEIYHECYTSNINGHSITVNVVQPGWFTNNVLATTQINRLNGHTVTIDIQRVKKVQIE